jgi:hypothetical protein
MQALSEACIPCSKEQGGQAENRRVFPRNTLGKIQVNSWGASAG